ncbi:MAG: helicase-associated domain-containing protein [Armatimonadota bacterium]
MMEVVSERFDPYLENVRADELKRMVRLWDGKGLTRKADCIAVIRRGLADPRRVQAALESLTPAEHTALGLLKLLGNAVDYRAFGLALCAAGIDRFPRARFRRQGPDGLPQALVSRGLLLSRGGYDPGSFDQYSGHVVAFSDERLLAHVGPPTFEPLDLAPLDPPPTVLSRRPQSVALDLIAFLQAVDGLGGLSLTKAGAVRVADERKLKRAMLWDDEIDLDGVTFPHPAPAFLEACACAGLLAQEADRLVLTHPISRVGEWSYREQATALLHGFLHAASWVEWEPESLWDDQRERHCHGRLALTVTLARLPQATPGFFAIDDLDAELFARIGEHFALRYPPHKPYYFGDDTKEAARREQEWRVQLRDNWLERERHWLARALCTWLYALGLVEVGLEDDSPVSFRLTDLGSSVLHPEAESRPAAPTHPAEPSWVVQPNFDVVVYLDRATPSQLAFMERHAERVDAQQHTAHYRLTRESVYEGLESGTRPEELLTKLGAGSQAELPQNVLAEIREWVGRREQMALRRRACLLEFVSEAARDAAVADGISATPVGERFALLTGRVGGGRRAAPLRGVHASKAIDYAQPLPECLSVSEDGVVRLRREHADLLIAAQLDRWAERTGDHTWRLTACSVSAAIAAGVRIRQLLNLLQERLTRRAPPLLDIALRAWAGQAFLVEMTPLTVLRCTQPEVFKAIVRSRKLKPYLLGALAPDVLVVDAQQLDAVEAHLAWAGLTVSPDLVVVPR